ncbi:hypothetical protein PL960_00285 [Bifidobacterium adolescentis]|nr:hypothetical protein [Bifidobacterium adolescentis]MDB1500741.1 hypothetical protein [Bifidobacterium adolescentis]
MNIFQQREQILANLIEACKDHDEEKTNHLLNQLTELDKSAEQKPLPEEPKERGFYVTANDGRLLLKDIDDDWSALTYDNSADPIWNGGRQYVKWPKVCAKLPPEAFPLKRVNTGSNDD